MTTNEFELRDIRKLFEKVQYLSEISWDYIQNSYLPVHELNFTKNDLNELEILHNKIIVALEQSRRNFFKNK